jgi:hypothetical protein
MKILVCSLHLLRLFFISQSYILIRLIPLSVIHILFYTPLKSLSCAARRYITHAASVGDIKDSDAEWKIPRTIVLGRENNKLMQYLAGNSSAISDD